MSEKQYVRAARSCRADDTVNPRFDVVAVPVGIEHLAVFHCFYTGFGIKGPETKVAVAAHDVKLAVGEPLRQVFGVPYPVAEEKDDFGVLLALNRAGERALVAVGIRYNQNPHIISFPS